MHKAGNYFITAPDTENFSLEYIIKSLHINKFIFFRRHTRDKEKMLKTISAIRYLCFPDIALISVDEEGGMVSRLSHIIGGIPGAMALSACDDSIIYEVYSFLFGALRQLGYNLDYMPVLDILHNFKNSSISTRAYGYDRKSVERCASIAVFAAEDQGMFCCLKHFPGLGRTEIDSHYGLPVISGEKSAIEKDMEIYRNILKERSNCFIMTAHALYRDFGDSISTFSRKLISGKLKEDLAFSGAVISDDLLMGALDSEILMENRAVKAFKAGMDLLLVSRLDDRFIRMYSALEKSIEEGAVTNERLNDADKRIAFSSLKAAGRSYFSPQESIIPESILHQVSDILYSRAKIMPGTRTAIERIIIHIPSKILSYSPVIEEHVFTGTSIAEFKSIGIDLYDSFIDISNIDRGKTHIIITANPYYSEMHIENLKELDEKLEAYYMISLGEPQEGFLMHNAKKIIYLCTANETVLIDVLIRLTGDIAEK